MDKFLYPHHPVYCLITRPSECGKPSLLTNLVLKVFKQIEKIYIKYSSLGHDLYQKSFKCFSDYIPRKIMPNILKEVDLDLVIDEIVNDDSFEQSETEIEKKESIDVIRYLQDHENYGIKILDDLNK